jgi:hypothetical protein
MYAGLMTTDRALIVKQLDLLDAPETIRITIEKRGDLYRLVASQLSAESEIPAATTS